MVAFTVFLTSLPNATFEQTKVFNTTPAPGLITKGASLGVGVT